MRDNLLLAESLLALAEGLADAPTPKFGDSLVEADAKDDSRALRISLQAVNAAQDSLTESKAGIMRCMGSIERLDPLLMSYDDSQVRAIKAFEAHFVKNLRNITALSAEFGKVYQELLGLIGTSEEE